MNRKSIVALLALLACLGCLISPAAAAEVDCDSVYCFSGGDFSEDRDLAGICITGLPDRTTGTALLGVRVLQPGDILTAAQLEKMTFQPLQTETNREAIVTYLPIYADRVEAVTSMSIAVIGKTDQAPVAEDSAMETYKNLPNEALLKVKDPEGKPMTYTLIRQPKRGDVVLREDGSFHYTPKKNKVGIDSFTYTATDPAGNVSREATVTVTILKPEDARQYTDTAGKSCRFAAEWMKNTGIFVSESMGGNGCFRPEKTVSRGEFLTMLAGALNLQIDEDAVFTGFSDEAPDWLKPYLAAALRSGLTAGWPHGDTFDADTPITGSDAAVLLQNALDLSIPTAAEGETPDALAILAAHGIQLEPEAQLTRGEIAEMLYQTSLLANSAPGMRVLPQAAQ